jgi:hypothetical protein
MTRNMRRAAVAVMLGGLGAAGCHHAGGGGNTQPEGWTRYYNAVDPCWPERYNAQARAEVLAPFAAQVNNGHVLEQTVWNWHFETGSDILTPAGQAKLDAIAQARPQPDGRIYLQVARDVPAYGAGGLDTVAARRDDLTAKRALQPVAYEVFVHDAPVPGMPADFAARAYRGMTLGYVGGLRTSGATVVTTGSGGVTTTTTNTSGSQGGPSGPGGPGGPGTGPGTGGTGGPNY